jgi:hypothetical protein
MSALSTASSCPSVAVPQSGGRDELHAAEPHRGQVDLEGVATADAETA